MTRRRAAKAGGLAWEPYDRDWSVDWDYHCDDPTHLFRSWGFPPGHLAEWAKRPLILARHVDADWLLPTARHLFDTAAGRAWDEARASTATGRRRPASPATTPWAHAAKYCGCCARLRAGPGAPPRTPVPAEAGSPG